MTIVKWDPLRSMAALQDRINQAFDDAFPPSGDEDAAMCAWRPAVDIYEKDNCIVIEAELAGVRKEDVSVEIKDTVLTLRGERVLTEAVQEDDYYRKERLFGTFLRSFNLQAAVQPDKIRAKFADGILRIEIPRLEAEATRKITVSVD